MTRTEEIEKAAKRYIDNKLNLNKSIKSAFTDGVEWADQHPNLESLWHDVREEPTEGLQTILANCENSELKILKYRNGTPVQWSTFIIKNKITKWMYTHDILLKGGEK